MLYHEKSTLNEYVIGHTILNDSLLLKSQYCLSTHFFTVLPPIFFGASSNSHYYIEQSGLKLSLLKALSLKLTTVLPTIKVPSFQTLNYRTSTHASTALSNMYLSIVTVISNTKLIANFLKRFTYSNRKDVLKVDYKNNISVDDLFFDFKEERKSR